LAQVFWLQGTWAIFLSVHWSVANVTDACSESPSPTPGYGDTSPRGIATAPPGVRIAHNPSPLRAHRVSVGAVSNASSASGSPGISTCAWAPFFRGREDAVPCALSCLCRVAEPRRERSVAAAKATCRSARLQDFQGGQWPSQPKLQPGDGGAQRYGECGAQRWHVSNCTRM